MAQHALEAGPIGAEAARSADRVGPPAQARAVEASPAASGAKGKKRKSERSCIVTRSALPPVELVRFVLSPQGVVTPDIRRALPGRGVWVTASRARIAEALKRKAFARAFRRQVAMPADLADQVGELMRKDALQAISLANKAGAVISGFEKVRSALGNEEVLALIEASDGAPDGRRKLAGTSQGDAKAAPGEPSGARLSVIDCFSSAELDLALGRPHVIHAALLKAPAGGFALAKCLRFHRFELIEKHASGGAERRGATQTEPPFEPSDRAAGQKSE
jgi:predicted RNA-binding protein YlxR (DUF448 family)